MAPCPLPPLLPDFVIVTTFSRSLQEDGQSDITKIDTPVYIKYNARSLVSLAGQIKACSLRSIVDVAIVGVELDAVTS